MRSRYVELKGQAGSRDYESAKRERTPLNDMADL